MFFVNNEQQEKYYKIFREILKVIGASDNSDLKSAVKIKLFSIDDLPVGYVFKIHSMTIVVKSVVEKDNKFYQQISLNHMKYKMLEYDRIDLSEGMDVKECNETSRKCS